MVANIIVAHDLNRGIAKDGTIPWHISDDLRRFRRLTRAGLVIMGRTTWESLPVKPLPGRFNIIVTSSTRHDGEVMTGVPHTVKAASLVDALKYGQGPHKLQTWIIGGEQLYREAMNLPLLMPLYITEIAKDYHCDKFFPQYYDRKESEVSEWFEEDGVKYRYKILN